GLRCRRNVFDGPAGSVGPVQLPAVGLFQDTIAVEVHDKVAIARRARFSAGRGRGALGSVYRQAELPRLLDERNRVARQSLALQRRLRGGLGSGGQVLDAEGTDRVVGVPGDGEKAAARRGGQYRLARQPLPQW